MDTIGWLLRVVVARVGRTAAVACDCAIRV
jgi:hypothetical protein